LIHSSELLLNTTETMFIDLLEHAYDIYSTDCEEALLPPEEGLYVKSDMVPIIAKNALYVDEDGNPFNPYDDFPNNIRSVYAPNRDIIVTKQTLKKLARHITKEPTVPVIAMKICMAIAVHHLKSRCPYFKGGHNHLNFNGLIKPECMELVESDRYSEQFLRIRNSIDEFIGDDVNHIYFHKLVFGRTLKLDKVIDFRIYDWHRIQEEQHERSSSY
jgi:hypothetical protein